MTHGIFQEPSKGVVRHTAASKALADNPLLRQQLGMVAGELWPAATKAVDAMIKWPGSEEPNNAGFNIVNNTDATIFDEISADPARDQRYADAMKYFAKDPSLEFHHVLEGYEWNALGEGTVVDIGGSNGSLGIAIAQRFPSLRCVVQDRPEIIGGCQESLPSDLHGRVSFMAHDFFQEQPIKGAEIYTLRWILHDWSDKHAARILRALMPALKAGAKLLVLESVLPAPGEISKYEEKAFRSMDMTMLATHNAKERDMDDWKELFRIADPGYEILSVSKPQGSNISIIEAIWRPHGA
ncbi:MAG: hypothetical protein Q9186_004659 [Xanthomendoza sp. 1 TL-2023]